MFGSIEEETFKHSFKKEPRITWEEIKSQRSGRDGEVNEVVCVFNKMEC